MDATILTRKESRKKERHSADVTIEQIDPIVDRGEDAETAQIAILAKAVRIDPAKFPHLTKDYYEQLAFNEEPVTVRFTSGQDPHAPKFVDAQVNGKGIEVLTTDGKWLEVFQVPVNRNVTIKRKYLEVFARCKHTYVTARHEFDGNNPDPVNRTVPSSDFKHPHTIVEDKNPLGDEWYNKVASMRTV